MLALLAACQSVDVSDREPIKFTLQVAVDGQPTAFTTRTVCTHVQETFRLLGMVVGGVGYPQPAEAEFYAPIPSGGVLRADLSDYCYMAYVAGFPDAASGQLDLHRRLLQNKPPSLRWLDQVPAPRVMKRYFLGERGRLDLGRFDVRFDVPPSSETGELIRRAPYRVEGAGPDGTTFLYPGREPYRLFAGGFAKIIEESDWSGSPEAVALTRGMTRLTPVTLPHLPEKAIPLDRFVPDPWHDQLRGVGTILPYRPIAAGRWEIDTSGNRDWTAHFIGEGKGESYRPDGTDGEVKVRDAIRDLRVTYNGETLAIPPAGQAYYDPATRRFIHFGRLSAERFFTVPIDPEAPRFVTAQK
jgi:hypothetical protein